MKKRPPIPDPAPPEGDEIEAQDTIEQSVDTVEVSRVTVAKPTREAPRRGARPERPGAASATGAHEDSARWKALIDEITEERAGEERTEPITPAEIEASRRRAARTPTAPARRWKRASEVRGRREPLDDDDIETTVEATGAEHPPPEWYTQTKPEMQLTQRMQERFVQELRTELEPGDDEHERTDLAKPPPPPSKVEATGRSVWEEFPPSISGGDDAQPENEDQEFSQVSVTLVSRPLEAEAGVVAKTVQARGADLRAGGDDAVKFASAATAAIPTISSDPGDEEFPPRDGIPFGSYWLLRRLKAGGMGEVYMAAAPEVAGVARTVAIKRILLPLTESEDFVRMFIDEAKIMVLLNHPSIVQVYELGQVAKQYFIAMEYVHGRDLDTIMHDAVKQRDMLPIPVAVFIVQRALEGLDYAHRRCDARQRSLGIVHRDVSPPNILCSYEGQVKLTDFGIAKAATKVSMTRPGLVLGKTGYMAPEQIKSGQIDQRSDVFGAGVVLWELLAGRRLFRATNDAQTIRNVILGDIPDLRRVRADLPADVADLVRWALERDPERRPQWASELSERLQRALISNGYPSAQRALVEYMAENYGGSHAGEPIFRRR